MKRISSMKSVALSKGGFTATVLSMAALNLFGVSSNAFAEAAPERGEISLKYLDYFDYQPDKDRIQIRAPSVMVMTPVAGEWSITGTAVSDAVSGASPQYYNSRVTPMHDKRDAYSLSVSKYAPSSIITLGASHGSEHDYVSNGYSGQVSFLSDDKNTTWTVGVGYSADKILPNSPNLTIQERKNVLDGALGLTQVMGPYDLAQVTYRHSNGRGYYSDQYKAFDNRPRDRDSDSLLFRWNHHFAELDSTLRSSYRYYQDTYKIRSHTLGFEYVQNLSNGWTVMPLVRYYTQTQASFFYAPTNSNDPTVQFCLDVMHGSPDQCYIGTPYEKVYGAYSTGGYTSMDARLSAFGAITYGMKVTKKIGKDWIMDVKYEKYEQRGEWALSNGTTGLAPFQARSYQLGVTYYF